MEGTATRQIKTSNMHNLEGSELILSTEGTTVLANNDGVLQDGTTYIALPFHFLPGTSSQQNLLLKSLPNNTLFLDASQIALLTNGSSQLVLGNFQGDNANIIIETAEVPIENRVADSNYSSHNEVCADLKDVGEKSEVTCMPTELQPVDEINNHETVGLVTPYAPKSETSEHPTNSAKVAGKVNSWKDEVGRPMDKGPYSCESCGKEFPKTAQLKKHMKCHSDDKPYKCARCTASFNVESNLILHIATHNQDNPKCPECGKIFARLASLKAHIMLHEREENLFCSECGDEFSTQSQLDIHKKEHAAEWSRPIKMYRCQQCYQEFSRTSALREHMKDHYKVRSSLSRRIYKRNKDRTSFIHRCKTCCKSFQKPSQLVRHMRIHTGEKPFKCELCRRAFSQKGSVQIHMAKHSGVKPFRCEFCGATFSQKGNLRAHILRVHSVPHSGEEVFRCMDCPCVFKKLGSLNAHMNRAHSSEYRVCAVLDPAEEVKVNVNAVMTQLQKLQAETEKSQPEALSSQKDILEQALVKSGLSEKPANTATDIRKDEALESVVQENDGEDMEPQKTTVITLADKALDGSVRRYIIRQRRVGSVRWHQCSYCSKEFKKPSDLVRHIRIHTHEKPFKCTHCFRSFAVKSTLTAHISTHTGVKDHTCNICMKKFSSSSSLKVHQRLHSGKKPFQCHICDKSFRTSGHRKAHLLSHAKDGNATEKTNSQISKLRQTDYPHIKLQEPIIITETGLVQKMPRNSNLFRTDEAASRERPYKCHHCNGSFRKSDHLKLHIRMHTGEKPFKCNQCNKCFISNSVLKAHARTHDGVKLFSCHICNNRFSTSTILKRHMETHSETRSFMCPYCRKTFKTSGTCRSHMKKHHQQLILQALQESKKGETVSTNMHENSSQFPPTGLGPDFTQAFSDNPFSVIENEQHEQLEQAYVQTTLVHTDNLNQENDIENTASVITHTLHADGSGTITVPNLEGQHTLTQENIHELERTLTEQIFGSAVEGPATQAGNTEQQTVTVSEIQVGDVEGYIDVETVSNVNLLEAGRSSSLAQTLPQNVTNEERESISTPSQQEIAVVEDTSQHQTTNILEEVFESQGFDATVFSSINLQGSDSLTLALSTSVANMLPQSSTTKRPGQQLKNYLQAKDQGKSEEIKEDSSSVSESFENQLMASDKCGHCGKTFKNLKNLLVHMRQHAEEKIYACSICNKKYANLCTLRGHMAGHTKSGKLSCDICNYDFPNYSALYQHMMEDHTEESCRPFQCNLCGKQFRTLIQMHRHVKMHTPTAKANKKRDRRVRGRQKAVVIQLSAEETQVLAQQPLENTNSVSERVLIASAAERDRISEIMDPEQKFRMEPLYANKCKYCPKSFKKPSDLVRHVRIHTGERPYRCTYCNKCFTVKSTLDSHLKTHEGQKPFSCHVCGFYFSTKGSLKVHMRLHTGAKPFRCPICYARFRTSGHRKSHLASHIKENNKLKKIVPGKQKKRKNSINMENEHDDNKKMPAIVDSTNLLQTSSVVADLNTPTLVTTTDDTHIVNNFQFHLADGLQIDNSGNLISAQALQLDESLLQQIQTSNIIIQAPAATEQSDVAGVETVQVTTEDQTLDAVHFEIPFINVRQTSRVNVSSTNNIVFNVENDLDVDSGSNTIASESPQTSSRFRLSDSRKGGRSLVPINDQNETMEEDFLVFHDCQVCGKWFSKPSQLQRHTRIHTGEQPFQCGICSRRFNQKNALSIHLKNHAGEKPFSCPYCQHSFTQKGNLKTHIKRAHVCNSLDLGMKGTSSKSLLKAKLPVLNNSNEAERNVDLDRFVNDLFPQMSSTFLPDP